MFRHCPDCGSRLTRTVSRGGIPYEYCPECADTSPFHATDGGYERISNLTDLREGDRVLWNRRKIPLTVVRTTFGSRVVVEGFGDTTHHIIPAPDAGETTFRLLGDGRIDDLRRVEWAPKTAASRSSYEADWGVDG
ncbi:zf-TFIIB domain-containing protein [Halobaculum rarum]|uniref:zf-TFIIB domain-containing protein n=1 Tax=Halobaculum rarum TaxID=3075122 RepID=UPI0032AF562A